MTSKALSAHTSAELGSGITSNENVYAADWKPSSTCVPLRMSSTSQAPASEKPQLKWAWVPVERISVCSSGAVEKWKFGLPNGSVLHKLKFPLPDEDVTVPGRR